MENVEETLCDEREEMPRVQRKDVVRCSHPNDRMWWRNHLSARHIHRCTDSFQLNRFVFCNQDGYETQQNSCTVPIRYPGRSLEIYPTILCHSWVAICSTRLGHSQV